MSRCRVQMPISHYREIKGKIISKEEGKLRKEIDDNYKIVDDEFISKNDLLNDIAKSKKAPLGICSVDPADELSSDKDWLATNSGFIQGLSKIIDDKGEHYVELSDIQAFLCDNTTYFMWMDKCRQLGFSFLIAAKSLAQSMLLGKHTSIAVSYNEDESKEKIVFARELYESLPSKYKLGRKLKYDNKTSLVWEKAGKETTETRLLSFPQRQIRGKGGGVHIFLDEFAHCIHGRLIYTSAVPVLSRGSTALWIGSTPIGKGGIFWEIGVNFNNNYPLYTRLHINWWDIPNFCTDVSKARIEAPYLLTQERVEKFATDVIKAIFHSMVLDDFQQEYECAYHDEKYSYYPWDLINSCVPVFNDEGKELPGYDAPAGDLSQYDSTNAGTGLPFFTDFDSFLEALNRGAFKGNFLVGFDVGRTTDASEITILEEDSKNNIQTVRANITLKDVRLPDQRSYVKNVIFDNIKSRIIKFGVDYTGIGRHITEDLEDISYDLVERCAFNSNEWKEEACRRFKYRMQVKGIQLPVDRNFNGQIHSIKRILLPGGTFRFDAEENAKHHGDKFWSMIAASEMGHPITSNNVSTPINLDKRIMTGEKRKTVDIIVPQMSSVIKYDPYGQGGFKTDISSIPAPNFSGLSMPQGIVPNDIIKIL